MRRRMIVPAGVAAVLGLVTSAALADGEKRTTVQDENRVELFDRAVEPSRREAMRAPGRDRRIAAYAHHRAHWRHPHRASHSWGGHYGLHSRRHLFVAGAPHGFPGVVNVATVIYRTHVYHTPVYPSALYGYPPHAHLYDVTPGPIYNKPCFC
jgi:hypothetical protein